MTITIVSGMAKIAAAAEYVKCVLELQNISDSTHCSRELISRVFKTLFTYDVYSTIRPFIKLEVGWINP